MQCTELYALFFPLPPIPTIIVFIAGDVRGGRAGSSLLEDISTGHEPGQASRPGNLEVSSYFTSFCAQGLPLKDQRELMAQHAEMFLSQSSLRSVSRSGSNTSLSQPSSRRASITTEDVVGGVKPDAGEEEKNERRGILKDKSASNKDLHEVRGILRPDPIKAPSEPEFHSILKGSCDVHLPSSSSEPRGILKKAKSEDIPSMDSSEELKSILKHADSDEEEKPGKPRSRSNSQPFGILKRETSPQPGGEVEIRSILKTPSHENVPQLISAMRRGSNDSDSSATGSGGLRSALKHRGHNSEGEEGQTECSAAAATTSECCRSALHKPHASSAGDNFDDANSHIHVDLTLTISNADSHEAASKTTIKPSSMSPKNTPRSSLDRGDEGAALSTMTDAAPLSTSCFSPSKSDDKDTLKVPEDSEAKLGTSASEGEGESSAGELLDEPTTNRLRKKSRMNRSTNSESVGNRVMEEWLFIVNEPWCIMGRTRQKNRPEAISLCP
ncbi:hypothetical protein Btru_006591 [Bulinus truncatus]|nr:hypothetical protein Btru_006591 [Bulinus truncatus]